MRIGGSNQRFSNLTLQIKNVTIREYVYNSEKQLTIGDNEFRCAALDFFGLALLVDPVGLLVVDEELGGALATHPLVKHGLVGRLIEWLLCKHDDEIQIRGRVRYGHDCATF